VRLVAGFGKAEVKDFLKAYIIQGPYNHCMYCFVVNVQVMIFN